MTDNNQWGAGVNYIVLAVLYCTLEVHVYSMYDTQYALSNRFKMYSFYGTKT